MTTIKQKLQSISNIKDDIKDTIISNGVSVPLGTKFEDYPGYISLISSGSTPLTATLGSGVTSNGFSTFSGYGTYMPSGNVGAPGLTSSINAIIVIEGNVVYQGNLGVPEVGKYIPIAGIKYKAKIGGSERYGYFSIVRNAAGTGGTYTVVDRDTGTNIELSGFMEYDVTMTQGLIFRDSAAAVVTGNSAINASVFGLEASTVISYPSYKTFYYSVYPIVSYSVSRAFNIPKSVKHKIINDGFSYVSVTADIFTGASNTVTNINKGSTVDVSNIITF